MMMHLMTGHPWAVLKQTNRKFGSKQGILKAAQWGIQIPRNKLSSSRQTPETLCHNHSQKGGGGRRTDGGAEHTCYFISGKAPTKSCLVDSFNSSFQMSGIQIQGWALPELFCRQIYWLKLCLHGGRAGSLRKGKEGAILHGESAGEKNRDIRADTENQRRSSSPCCRT